MATGGDLTRSKINASDEIIDYTCSPCSKKKKTNEAVKFCVECQEFLCSFCVESHNSFSALTGHSLLAKSQFGSVDGPNANNLPLLPTERCKLHLTKLEDMYCENHDVVGCSVCFNLHHRNCQDVHYVPNYVKGLKPTKEMSNLQSEVTATIEKLESLMKQHMVSKNEFNENRASSLQEIRIFRKEINKTLDRLEQVSIKNINDQYKMLEQIAKKKLQVFKEGWMN